MDALRTLGNKSVDSETYFKKLLYLKRCPGTFLYIQSGLVIIVILKNKFFL